MSRLIFRSNINVKILKNKQKSDYNSVIISGKVVFALLKSKRRP